jgi:hypothetical protein
MAYNFQTGKGNQRRLYRKPGDSKPKTHGREMSRRLRQRAKGMIA